MELMWHGGRKIQDRIWTSSLLCLCPEGLIFSLVLEQSPLSWVTAGLRHHPWTVGCSLGLPTCRSSQSWAGPLASAWHSVLAKEHSYAQLPPASEWLCSHGNHAVPLYNLSPGMNYPRKECFEIMPTQPGIQLHAFLTMWPWESYLRSPHAFSPDLYANWKKSDSVSEQVTVSTIAASTGGQWRNGHFSVVLILRLENTHTHQVWDLTFCH